MLTAFALLALTANAPTVAVEPVRADSFAIRGTRVHLTGGRVVDNGVVLIENGRVSAVGASVPVPDGVSVIEHDGDVTAGMIALHDYSGALGENYDPTRAFLPEAELAHAFDPDHSDFDRLLAEGVTSIVLAPASSAVVGGVTAVVKTAGGRVLKRRAHLDLSFSASSLQRNRYPTSYGGAVAELDNRFEDPQGSFAELAAGKLPALLRVGSRQEVLRAIDFAKRHKLMGALSGATRSGEFAAEIEGAKLSVILPPFSPGADSRAAKSAVQLAEAGVPFGFALDAPGRHPASLRLAAAACMRAGLDKGAAWGALTSGAAQVAGVAGRVGGLAAGLDADLVLWSGDPLDLQSSVIAVYVDGKHVHGGDE